MAKRVTKGGRGRKRVRRRPDGAGPRERLLDAADRLFYAEGIGRTGIDRVLSEAGVAKQSLYDHFEGKDGLIAAYLERRDERFMAWFMKRLDARPLGKRERLRRVLDVVGEFVEQPGFCGCAFIAAAEEFADDEHPARLLAARNKLALRAFLIELARDAGAANAEAVGGAYALLVDGVLVAARLGRGRAALADAKAAVAVLVGD